jgi:hypothetical protein
LHLAEKKSFVLTTYEVTNLEGTSATCGGTILELGSGIVIDRVFVGVLVKYIRLRKMSLIYPFIKDYYDWKDIFWQKWNYEFGYKKF